MENALNPAMEITVTIAEARAIAKEAYIYGEPMVDSYASTGRSPKRSRESGPLRR